MCALERYPISIPFRRRTICNININIVNVIQCNSITTQCLFTCFALILIKLYSIHRLVKYIIIIIIHVIKLFYLPVIFTIIIGYILVHRIVGYISFIINTLRLNRINKQEINVTLPRMWYPSEIKLKSNKAFYHCINFDWAETSRCRNDFRFCHLFETHFIIMIDCLW